MEHTSWESSEQWYDQIVGKTGHYYHENIVIPNILKLLNCEESHHSPSLLDLACGQGVLARALPKHFIYHGIDLSPSLIQSAKQLTKRKECTFSLGDICKPLQLKQVYTHATIILALQNVDAPEKALRQASEHLQKTGTLVLVLNHPCFRIPRQSHWGIDEKQKLQYRRVDRYLTPLKIPIQTHPSRGQHSQTTWSYHSPLSLYSQWLMESGFMITLIEEWRSDKKSLGKKAKMENRAREEFPLFLAIKAQKM